MFYILVGELDSVLGLDRMNQANAAVRAQAIAVMDESSSRRLIEAMRREAV